MFVVLCLLFEGNFVQSPTCAMLLSLVCNGGVLRFRLDLVDLLAQIRACCPAAWFAAG